MGLFTPHGWQRFAARLPCTSLREQGRCVIKAPSSFHALLLALMATGDAVADDLFSDTQAIPHGLTASRLKPPASVPGSVTLLDSALIEASGARNIAELLRLVAGMMVGYRTTDKTDQRIAARRWLCRLAQKLGAGLVERGFLLRCRSPQRTTLRAHGSATGQGRAAEPQSAGTGRYDAAAPGRRSPDLARELRRPASVVLSAEFEL